ncbi:unknow (plasmid) [Vibrio campbellii]|nr:unknow [Vibrio campbellii]
MRISIITLAFLMTGCFGDNQQDQEVKKAIDATVEF